MTMTTCFRSVHGRHSDRRKGDLDQPLDPVDATRDRDVQCACDGSAGQRGDNADKDHQPHGNVLPSREHQPTEQAGAVGVVLLALCGTGARTPSTSWAELSRRLPGSLVAVVELHASVWQVALLSFARKLPPCWCCSPLERSCGPHCRDGEAYGVVHRPAEDAGGDGGEGERLRAQLVSDP